MTAFCIAFTSAKGGAGKTVLSASMARCLAVLGKKVLLVDMDAATNGLTLLILPEVLAARTDMVASGPPPTGVFEVASSEKATPFLLAEGLSMLPASFELRRPSDDERVIPAAAAAGSLLAAMKDYDYVILDAQAGNDDWSRAAIRLADAVVIVSEFDPVSAEGVERLRYLIQGMRPGLDTRVLLNKVLPEFIGEIGDFLAIVKYLNPVPLDVEVVRAYARRRLALDMAHPNAFTLAVVEATRSLLGDAIEEAVAAWQQSVRQQIGAPAQARLQEVEEELDELERHRIGLEYRRRRGSGQVWIAVTVAAALVTVTSMVMTFVPATRAGFLRLLWSNKSPSDLIATVILTLVAAAVGYAVYQISTLKRPRARMEAEVELRALERRIDSLKDASRAFRVLASADLKTLVAQSARLTRLASPNSSRATPVPPSKHPPDHLP